ncbi:serine/threonine-protein kinase STY17-like protein [Tanacetum coccineum]
MNSYTFMCQDDVEEEEISSRKKSFIKRSIAYIKIRRQANRVTRNSISRDHAGAHERLVAASFNDSPMYDETRFRKTFRMARPLFNRIVNAVTNHDAYFHSKTDCTGREGISPLIKCTSAIRQLAYGVNASFLDEYMQITVASQDLWIWHTFFGVAWSNNDINVLYQSFLFNDLKTGRAPEIPFVANGVTYRSGYYLVDRIYPELASLVKKIPELADDDHKRILYKQKQESAWKDVERAFGVLKKKWAILVNPTRALKKDRIINMMYTCIILHNIIRKYKKVAISLKWFPEEAHQPEDMLRNEEQVQQVMRWIR